VIHVKKHGYLLCIFYVEINTCVKQKPIWIRFLCTGVCVCVCVCARAHVHGYSCLHGG